MSQPGRPTARVALPLVLALAATLSLGQSGTAALPPASLLQSPGADLVRSRCQSCHGLDMLQQQRLDRAGWERELTKMIGWGASVSAAERSPVLEYLSLSFGPQGAVAPGTAATDRGSEVFRRACLGCHGSDMVEQQSLDLTGWTRELDKMTRWGASVGAADRAPLLEYLTGRYGPR